MLSKTRLNRGLGHYSQIKSSKDLGLEAIVSGNQVAIFSKANPIKLHLKVTHPQYYYIETDIDFHKDDRMVEIYMSDIGEKVRVNIKNENGTPRTIKITKLTLITAAVAIHSQSFYSGWKITIKKMARGV